MHRATFTLNPAFTVARIDPRVYGSFLEHMGRAVYTGVYEPGHPAADGEGIRQDVLELVRELGVTLVRYPGGNFVSGYRWEDGVGPVEERPTRLDLAWHSVETNAFGLNEFAAWAKRAEVEPMMAVNLGTRGLQEAVDLLEYTNHPGGTQLSELRKAHGVEEPHGIKLWCLGNEMDGPWQVGHKTAEEYARIAAETAKAMRLVDDSLELVACGSSSQAMPTFGAWETTVLEEAYEHVDLISAHAYYEEVDGDAASFLASAVDMESFIENVVATADAVRARKRIAKRIKISFDEWNVWYLRRYHADPPTEWKQAPRVIEDQYNLTDAVVVGSLLIALLRHADRVAVACLAQLVNVIAPIMTEPGGPAWRQTTFHPFALTSKYARGEVLRVEPESPAEHTERFGDVPVLHATATREEDGSVTVLAVNRGLTESVELDVDVAALGDGYRVVEHLIIADEDRFAVNTAEQPDRVTPRPVDGTVVADGRLRGVLPPISWSVIRLTPAAE
ncbi:arabinosylfuranosidase ArfA [Allostreptomyces psammosilenae]|uniref:non-reducing end alpha-L-arabinofuranosidase n=1 Tax=Allostreptomyces psammosilenae TaxID=1892865 RepID=A0A852ZM81_9ACTN|nr:alpha-N-arabinofuranosidase [Allostreptomyces psammosilenae]NYI03526.1 alpha-N-arabinofuranosidase [Allostreptomyces psammosilenae]